MRAIGWELEPEPGRPGTSRVAVTPGSGTVMVRWYCGETFYLQAADVEHVIAHVNTLSLVPEGWMDLGHYLRGVYVHLHNGTRLYCNRTPDDTGARSVDWNELCDAMQRVATDVLPTPET